MADEQRITDFENEALLDKFTDSPREVLTGLANEIRADLRAEIDRERYESQVTNTFEKFKSQYPDFEEKWKSGEIKAYMDRHAGHNALSAYYMLARDQQTRQPGDDERLKDSRLHGGKHAVLAQRLQDRRAGTSEKSSAPEPFSDLIPTV